jgi:signal transduction histidine kinase/HAMP domain-containing protein
MRSLRSQLVMSHLFLVLIMTLVMAGAIWQFFRVGRSIEEILQENYQTVLATQEMGSALHQQDVAFLMLLDGDKSGARQTYLQAREEFDRAYMTASASAREQREQNALIAISEDHTQIRRVASWLLGPTADLPTAELARILNQEVRPTLSSMRTRARALREMNEQEVRADYQSAQGRARRAAWRTILTSVGALILAILLGLRLVQRALTPLNSLAHRAERIASGVFQPGVSTNRKDEVGALAKSFGAMEEKLAEMRRTEARRLQRAERMSDAALESLYDPVVVTDAKRRIVYLNRAAAGLFGDVDTHERKPVEEHIPDRRIVKAIKNALADRVSAGEDEAALIQIGTAEAERTYRLRATPMRGDEGQLLGTVTVLEDITYLRVVDRLKTEFIGVASHELRTPVTSLILANQLLIEGAVGDLNEGQREVVEAQQQDLNRLEKLMRDLLDVTRLEAGSSPPRLEMVTPKELVAGPMTTLKPQAIRKGLSLHIEVPEDLPRIRADRMQIGRVLTNLVANAIRHTNTGGVVTVRASASDKDVSFRVEDTGEGIPKDYLVHVFERFVQVPGATQGGAGLGLSIAQNIVRAHGGQMAVESEEGRGSTFSFNLPIDSAEPGEGQTV